MNTFDRISNAAPKAFALGAMISGVAIAFGLIFMLSLALRIDQSSIRFQYLETQNTGRLPILLIVNNREFYIIERKQDNSMDKLADETVKRTDKELAKHEN